MWKIVFSNRLKLLLIKVLISEIFVCAKAEAVFYNLKPVSSKQYSIPDRHFALGHLNSGFAFKQKSTASMPGEDVFKIEASDAIDIVKYSQPDLAYSLFSLNGGMKVPSSFSKHKLLGTPAQNPSRVHFQEEGFPISHASEKDILKPVRDMRYLDSAVNDETSAVRDKETDKSENKNLHNIFEPQHQNDKATNLHPQTKNNFTDANDNLVSVSSDAILSYEVPVTEFNDSSTENSSQKLDTEMLGDVPSHDYSSYNISLESKTQNSIQLNTRVYIDSMNDSNLSTESVFPSIMSDENVTNSLPSTDSEKKLSSGTVAGIVIAVLICVTLLSSAVIYLLYRKFNGKCTSVVESKFNSDNCGYLDDSLRSSIYLNNHIELPKESSEEMTSLDNDSFLNSLETMTIQNYWADSSKNTKV